MLGRVIETAGLGIEFTEESVSGEPRERLPGFGCVGSRLLRVLIGAFAITDAVPPGVVASEKGAWLMTSRTGQTISALVSADMRADLAEGACFNDTAVEVGRA